MQVDHIAAVAAHVQQVLGSLPPIHQPLMEAGLDSLGAVELRNALSSQFKLDLPATLTFDFPSISAIAAFLDSNSTFVSQAGMSALSVPGSLSVSEVVSKIYTRIMHHYAQASLQVLVTPTVS